MICVQIVKLCFFHIKNEIGGKWCLSSFDALILGKENTVQTAKMLCTVYGDGTTDESIVCNGFTKLRSGNFDLKNQGHSYKPAVIDNVQIETLIKNPDHMTWDRAEIHHISHMCIVKYLKTLWYMHGCLKIEKKNLMDYSNNKMTDFWKDWLQEMKNRL